MKNSEQAIEKVLAGLRDSDAPVGMERRILEALQDQTSMRSRLGWRRLRPFWLATPLATRSAAWGVALAGVVAIVFIPAIRRLEHVPAPAKMVSAPVASFSPAAPEVAEKSVQPPPPRLWMRQMKAATLEGKATARRAPASSGSDLLALDEMHAASHPAPPMPLTEQEKLLLRIAHKGDPVEFAELDPVQRAARDADERAEVERFFVPTTKGGYE